MSTPGMSRHLVRRSDLVANGGKAEIPSRARNDAVDPERHFATAIYRIAKGSFDHLVGKYDFRPDIDRIEIPQRSEP